MSQHCSDVRALGVGLRLGNVQTGFLCRPERQLDVRFAVVGPLRLGGQNHFQHGLVLVLAFGGFEQLDHLIGAGMERGVADHQTHIVRVLLEDVLDDGIERPAGLARRVKELDDGDRRIAGAKDR
ncbi:MAG: hypothetical protein RLZ63_2347 [Pseudomonadota bacterium]